MRRFIADDEEAELVDIYRDLQPASRIAVLATAKSLLASDNTPSTKRHPYKTAPAIPKAK